MYIPVPARRTRRSQRCSLRFQAAYTPDGFIHALLQALWLKNRINTAFRGNAI
jgi:hypothetical protein